MQRGHDDEFGPFVVLVVPSASAQVAWREESNAVNNLERLVHNQFKDAPELGSRLHSWYRSTVSGAEQPRAIVDVRWPAAIKWFIVWMGTSLPLTESTVQGSRAEADELGTTLNFPSSGQDTVWCDDEAEHCKERKKERKNNKNDALGGAEEFH